MRTNHICSGKSRQWNCSSHCTLKEIHHGSQQCFRVVHCYRCATQCTIIKACCSFARDLAHWPSILRLSSTMPYMVQLLDKLIFSQLSSPTFTETLLHQEVVCNRRMAPAVSYSLDYPVRLENCHTLGACSFIKPGDNNKLSVWPIP